MRLHSGAGRIEVVENCLGCAPVLGQIQLRGGHHEVLDDHAFCAVRQRKHLPYRFGRIVCMVFELLSRQMSVFASKRDAC